MVQIFHRKTSTRLWHAPTWLCSYQAVMIILEIYTGKQWNCVSRPGKPHRFTLIKLIPCDETGDTWGQKPLTQFPFITTEQTPRWRRRRVRTNAKDHRGAGECRAGRGSLLCLDDILTASWKNNNGLFSWLFISLFLYEKQTISRLWMRLLCVSGTSKVLTGEEPRERRNIWSFFIPNNA